MNQKSSRRHFLKGAVGGLGGMLAARVAGFFPEAQPLLARATHEVVPISRPVTPAQVDVGELYAGFLLLPEEIPVPAFVKYPLLGPPILCGVGQKEPQLTGYSRLFTSVEEIAASLDFPIYTLSNLPTEFQSRGGSIIWHNTGEIYAASVHFEVYNKESNLWETVVSIWAQPEYPKPYPLWWRAPVEPDGPAITLNKIDSLPTLGIRSDSQQGNVFYWIKDDILYTLAQEAIYLLQNLKSTTPLGSLEPIP